MTDKEAIDLYNNLIKEFGSVPNPIHQPKAFAYFVNFYRFLQTRTPQTPPQT
jgi:hypothetical protein